MTKWFVRAKRGNTNITKLPAKDKEEAEKMAKSLIGYDWHNVEVFSKDD